MSKIEELVDERFYINPETGEYHFNLFDLKLIAYRYAEYYAQKCITEIASDYVTFNCPTWKLVDRNKILEFKLPEHE